MLRVSAVFLASSALRADHGRAAGRADGRTCTVLTRKGRFVGGGGEGFLCIVLFCVTAARRFVCSLPAGGPTQPLLLLAPGASRLQAGVVRRFSVFCQADNFIPEVLFAAIDVGLALRPARQGQPALVSYH